MEKPCNLNNFHIGCIQTKNMLLASTLSRGELIFATPHRCQMTDGGLMRASSGRVHHVNRAYVMEGWFEVDQFVGEEQG